MKIEARDVFTPANAVSLIGLGLTIHGATELNSLQGVIEIGLGRAMDVLDGPIARRTHASRFGAALDAVSDKIAIGALIVGSWQYDTVPKPVIGLIAAQNVISAGISVYAEKQKLDMDSSKDGKHSMFLNILAMGSFALSSVVESAGLERGLEVAGIAAAIGGLTLGTKAIIGYARHTFGHRKQ